MSYFFTFSVGGVVFTPRFLWFLKNTFFLLVFYERRIDGDLPRQGDSIF